MSFLVFGEQMVKFTRNSFRGGRQLVAGDFALSAGFGSTATVSNVVAGSTDMAGEFTITSSGTGQALNPTVTFTFADGAFRNEQGGLWVPLALMSRNGGAQLTVDFSYVATATTLVMTFPGTPVAAQTYTTGWRLSG
jgi:hypothetical protein